MMRMNREWLAVQLETPLWATVCPPHLSVLCLRQMDGWSGGQRKAVLQDLVLSCSVEQPSFLSSSVSRRLPLQAADFSCLLPRAICLYVFSFLDPRSLCRCARVLQMLFDSTPH